MIIEDWLLIFMALALVIVIWDVIRHRRMAKRIAEAQKMESIGRLAGGIAHDFNNMLAGISSAADFIKLKLGKKHELYRYAQIIVDSCIRASASDASAAFVLPFQKRYAHAHRCSRRT